MACCANARRQLALRMRPAEPGELLEYGTLFLCGCSRIPARDACNGYVTRHLVLLLLASVVAAYSCALLITAQVPGVPWFRLTSFNGTSAENNVWVVRSSYSLDGSVSSLGCPVSPSSSSSVCVFDPPGFVAPRLTDIAPGADVGVAFARMQPIGFAAQALWALAVLMLAAFVWPTARLPPGARESFTPPTVVRVALLCAFAAAAAACVAVFMGVPEDAVYGALLANATAVVDADGDGDGAGGAQPPASAAGLRRLQLSRDSGFAVAAAALGLLAAMGLLALAAGLASPRWLLGTRQAWYDAELARGRFVAPESRIRLRPCDACGGALEAQLALAQAERAAMSRPAGAGAAADWGAGAGPQQAPQAYAPGYAHQPFAPQAYAPQAYAPQAYAVPLATAAFPVGMGMASAPTASGGYYLPSAPPSYPRQ